MPPRKNTNHSGPHRSKSESSKNFNINQSRRSNNNNTTPSHHTSSVSAPLPFPNRYSIISHSPSMEQLLLDYTPPPKYNENHARQAEVILAASRQASQDSTTGSSLSIQSNPLRTPTPVLSRAVKHRPPYTKQRSESQKSSSATSSLVSGQCLCFFTQMFATFGSINKVIDLQIVLYILHCSSSGNQGLLHSTPMTNSRILVLVGSSFQSWGLKLKCRSGFPHTTLTALSTG